jgi:glycerol-3-phosphate dehydrogenase
MSVRLTDIVVRRTGMGSAGAPPGDAVERSARIAAAELGWDDARLREEIAAVTNFYEVIS